MTFTGQDTCDPLALLGEIQGRLNAAKAESWAVSERHSRDLSDEGWSEVAITITDESLPLPPQVALTYLSGLLEPDNEEANTAFIVGAGKDMARLLAIPDALLKLAASLEERSAPLTVIGDDDYDPDGATPDYWAGRAAAHRYAGKSIRSVIAAALSGKETPS